MRNLYIVLAFSCLLEQVLSDGYGGGGGHGGGTQVYQVPSGGKGGRWRIRAKGKGMQNLITHSSGGGGHGGGGGGGHGGGGHHTQIVYVPVPTGHGGHGGGYGHGGGHDGYSHEHEVSIIPIYGGHGGGGHDDYSHSMYGHGSYY